MIRERSIERAGQRLLRLHGYTSVKRGKDGWPDREVFVAAKTHEWIEWKRPGGRLTPAQVRRVDRLRRAGERVWVLDDLSLLSLLIEVWTHAYGPPPALGAV